MNAIMIWMFLAGLGIFLFGMWMLEDSLKKLAGRTFKLFLQKHTSSKAGAIISGAIVTAVLQSSSVVSLMVLAFVGAGVMNMRNGLGVVFGSNLGTTASNWIVVLLGFQFNIESFFLPVIAVSAIGFIIFRYKSRIRDFCAFGIGFGFLFLGLDYMKEAMENLVTSFDFSPYTHYPVLFFVVVGFVVTALIQSSSVTMVIALSALHTEVIPFVAAAGVIAGSELGTAVKTLFGSIGSIPAKKRVALGNIIFNLVITVFSIVFLGPIVRLVTGVAGEENPLIGLVFFQSFINFAGLLLFYPFIGMFGDFLEKRFIRDSQHSTVYISKVSPTVPGASMEALEKEVLLFVTRVSYLNQDAFHIQQPVVNHPVYLQYALQFTPEKNPYTINYEKIKEAEGEILSFCVRMRKAGMDDQDQSRMEELLATVRNAMYSAKSMKDILHNRKDFRNSADHVKYENYKFFQEQLKQFYKESDRIILLHEKSVCFEELVRLLRETNTDYEKVLSRVYEETEKGHLSETDTATLLNVNRELLSSRKAFLNALKHLLLDEMQEKDFDSITFQSG